MKRLCLATCALALALFLPSLARADAIGLATLGDSLTDTYTGKPYAGSNHSWTDLVQTYRSSDVNLFNFAKAGATSADVLAQGQPASAVVQVKAGNVHYVTLAVGGNDVGAFLAQINPANPATLDPTPHVAQLVTNVAKAAQALQASGAKVVLANVPDISLTPSMQSIIGGNPQLVALTGVMTDAINAQLKQLASSLGVPLVDLHKLNALSSGPLVLGGQDVHGMLYSIDGFHPSSLGSGLLANAEFEALREKYGVNVPQFSTSELLALAGLEKTGAGDFKASNFVIQPVPEPSALLLVGLGGIGLFAWRRRKLAA
jgi:lysophospholipase L1-like esterase